MRIAFGIHSSSYLRGRSNLTATTWEQFPPFYCSCRSLQTSLFHLRSRLPSTFVRLFYALRPVRVSKQNRTHLATASQTSSFEFTLQQLPPRLTLHIIAAVTTPLRYTPTASPSWTSVYASTAASLDHTRLLYDEWANPVKANNKICDLAISFRTFARSDATNAAHPCRVRGGQAIFPMGLHDMQC